MRVRVLESQRKLNRLDLNHMRVVQLIQDLDLNHILRHKESLRDVSIGQLQDFSLLEPGLESPFV